MGCERRWTTEIYDRTFERWFEKELDQYEQAVLRAAIEQILERYGIDICEGEWGKPLGDGLYEFRIRQSLHAILSFGQPASAASPGSDITVLLRVFVTFHGDHVVVLFHGYNKKKHPSAHRQRSEIARARMLYREWKRR